MLASLSLLDGLAGTTAQYVYFCMLTTRGLAFLPFQGYPASEMEPSEIWKINFATTSLAALLHLCHPCHSMVQYYPSL